MAVIPPCPTGITALLEGGLPVRFAGAAPADPAICVQEWNGKEHRYYLGFWGDGSFIRGTAEERAALRRLLTSPVGTEETFVLPRKTRFSLWKSATVAHVANTSLDVGGKPRPAIELKIVLHDALGRPHVQAEHAYWIDVQTGIPLEKQTVTRLADGNVWRSTNWRVVQLDGLAPGTVEASGKSLATPGSS
jgi:hypothetical protein